MKTREMEKALAAADPVGRGRVDGIDLEAMEADLLPTWKASFSALLESEATRLRPRRPKRFALAFGSAALAVALAAFLVLAGGGSNQPLARLRRRARPLRRVDAAAAARRARLARPERRRVGRRRRTCREHRGQGRWNSSPASRSPTNRFGSRASARSCPSTGSIQSARPSASQGCSRRRCASAGSNCAGSTARCRTRSSTAHEMLAPPRPALDQAAGPGHDRRRRHPRRVLRQPGRARQSPDDRPLVRRRLRARTEGRGPRSGRLRRTARLADPGRLADLARRDAGEGRQSRRPRCRGARNAEGDPRARRLHALDGSPTKG